MAVRGNSHGSPRKFSWQSEEILMAVRGNSHGSQRKFSWQSEEILMAVRGNSHGSQRVKLMFTKFHRTCSHCAMLSASSIESLTFPTFRGLCAVTNDHCMPGQYLEGCGNCYQQHHICTALVIVSIAWD